MKKKFFLLSVSSFMLFVLIELFTYFFYHYFTAEGFGVFWHAEPYKPFITFLFGIWGTMFLFSAIISLLIALIFYKN